jgi:hypothetical protein
MSRKVAKSSGSASKIKSTSSRTRIAVYSRSRSGGKGGMPQCTKDAKGFCYYWGLK